MSVHFHPVAIKEIRKETADCVSIAFIIPESLQELFKYKAGQYLTLRTQINGNEIRRSYSLCSSPLEKEWRIAVKKVNGGLFSTYANEQLKAGDIIEVIPPMGKFFTNLSAENKNNYIGLAAGSGITPLISIIKTALITQPHCSFTLVYGNRQKHSIIFKEQLEALKNKYIDRFSLIYILSREITDATLNYGRIDANKCTALFSKALNIKADEFFICGPEEMIFCVKKYLTTQGVNERIIHFELFTTRDKNRLSSFVHPILVDNESRSKITIKLDGIDFNFELAFKDKSILDAALHHGADLPYSCKGGVCSSCRAKLIEGKIDMEANYALEPEEIEKGYILACQSHPITEKVIIDFDIK